MDTDSKVYFVQKKQTNSMIIVESSEGVGY